MTSVRECGIREAVPQGVSTHNVEAGKLHEERVYHWYAKSDYERIILKFTKEKGGKKVEKPALLEGHFVHVLGGVEGVAIPQAPPECKVLRHWMTTGWERETCIHATINE